MDMTRKQPVVESGNDKIVNGNLCNTTNHIKYDNNTGKQLSFLTIT